MTARCAPQTGNEGAALPPGYDVEAGTIPQDRADKHLDDFFGQVTGIKVRRSPPRSPDSCLPAGPALLQPLSMDWSPGCPAGRHLPGARRAPELASAPAGSARADARGILRCRAPTRGWRLRPWHSLLHSLTAPVCVCCGSRCWRPSGTSSRSCWTTTSAARPSRGPPTCRPSATRCRCAAPHVHGRLMAGFDRHWFRRFVFVEGIACCYS